MSLFKRGDADVVNVAVGLALIFRRNGMGT